MPMTTDGEKAAVLTVLEAETEAWLKRDMKALASFWIQSPQSRRMSSVAHHGTHVQVGWDAIIAAFEAMAKQYPETYDETRITRERMNIVINGDMAWATFDQIGKRTGDNFELAGTQHELRVFQRVNGEWKINCNVILQRKIDQETSPLIEISLDQRVLWMNSYAHDQINDHPFLMIRGGRLLVRDRIFEGALKDAIRWADERLYWNSPPAQPNDRARVVIFGENDDAIPVFCWVVVEDGKILVSLADDQQTKQKIALAQSIYDLTSAQTQLAELLAQGYDALQAAKKLGVSINTVRTHLQRLFDRTGVRTQSALVSLLLSTEAPTIK